MDAQVVGYRQGVDQPAEFDLYGAADFRRAVDERQRLLSEIAAARRRMVAARESIAATQDPVLRAIRMAQQTLVEEQRASNTFVGGIVSSADAEVARILGRDAPLIPPRFDEAAARFSGNPTNSTADLPWLESELDRLCARSAALEAEGGRLQEGSRAGVAGESGAEELAVLEPLLADAVAAMREEHQRVYFRAVEEAGRRVAEAQEKVAASSRPRPPDDPGLTRSGGWLEPQPEAAVPSPAPMPVRDTPVEPQQRQVAPTSAPPLPRKPMILDIVLPLIAVAIVLLVVLSWIG